MRNENEVVIISNALESILHFPLFFSLLFCLLHDIVLENLAFCIGKRVIHSTLHVCMNRPKRTQ